MKKILSALLAFILIFTVYSSTAMAGSAPSAKSHFTSAAYNKIYEDEQGITHTVKATKVSEVWNKAGNVMHIVETKETYTDADGNDHVIVRDDSKIYSNACPKYPKNPHQTVYRVEWYPDGHSKVIYDYRPVSTPAPKASPKPTARPTAKPTMKPTLAPTAIQTTVPIDSPEPTPEPTVSSTEAPDVNPSPSSLITPSIKPTVTTSSIAVQIKTPVASLDPTPTATSIPVQAGQGKNPKNLVWILVVFCVVCAGIILLLKKRIKEPKT